MKYYYIVSQNTTCLCLHTENIAIKENFQEALNKLNSYSDKGYYVGSGTITKINDSYERQFVWVYHEGVLISKFDCVNNKKISIDDDFDEETRLNLKNAPDEEILERLAKLEDEVEDGTLVELPYKYTEELNIIKDGMIFIFYKMCLEQNLGQAVFIEYKSKINEWFKNYLKNKGLQEKGK